MGDIEPPAISAEYEQAFEHTEQDCARDVNTVVDRLVATSLAPGTNIEKGFMLGVDVVHRETSSDPHRVYLDVTGSLINRSVQLSRVFDGFNTETYVFDPSKPEGEWFEYKPSVISMPVPKNLTATMMKMFVEELDYSIGRFDVNIIQQEGKV